MGRKQHRMSLKRIFGRGPLLFSDFLLNVLNVLKVHNIPKDPSLACWASFFCFIGALLFVNCRPAHSLSLLSGCRLSLFRGFPPLSFLRVSASLFRRLPSLSFSWVAVPLFRGLPLHFRCVSLYEGRSVGHAFVRNKEKRVFWPGDAC